MAGYTGQVIKTKKCKRNFPGQMQNVEHMDAPYKPRWIIQIE
jgi:hypothetical protein